MALQFSGFRVLIVGLGTGLVWGSPPTVDIPTVFSRNRDALVLITAQGSLYNGKIDTEMGSGFLVAKSGLVLTNNHVVLDRPDDYKQIAITGKVGSRTAPTFSGRVVARDPVNDLAVVQLDGLPNPTIVNLGHSAAVATGQAVSAMGFPLKYELSINTGVVSNRTEPNRWHTDAALNPGNSGGPVFDGDGLVIGVVLGGAVRAEVPGAGTVNVEGIKFFAPIDTFHDGLAALVNVKASSGQTNEPVKMLDEFSRSYSVSEIKDDHPVVLASHSRQYERTFSAEPGYRIVRADFVSNSANFASAGSPVVSEDRTRVSLRFTLTSGPLIDQYRGWLDGTVITVQRRQ